MKILYQSFTGFLKDYLINWFSYKTNYPLFVKPWRVNFDITHSCPLRCVMCNIWKQKSKDKELSLEKLKELIGEIKDWGIDHISFAGGETLVRKNVVIELVKYASAKGMRTDLITNGHLLDRKTCKSLFEAGLTKLSISVDGAKARTHDKMRGKGSFRKVMAAVKTAKKLRDEMKADVELEFTTTILSYNFRELIDIFYLMRKMGFDYITYQVIVPDNSFTLSEDEWKKVYESKMWIKEGDIPELKKIVERLIEIKRRTGMIRNTRDYLRKIPKYFELKDRFQPGKCIVGFSYLNIDPYGNVNICGLGPNLNVNNTSLKKIWKSKQYAQTRKLIKKCNKPCMLLCYDKLEFWPLLEAWMELREWLK